MKFIKKITEPITREVIEYYQCDRCKHPIGSKGMYDAFEFTLQLKEGTAYPEGGEGTLKEMDLCHPCSLQLMKDLTDLGYAINESEWDYY